MSKKKLHRDSKHAMIAGVCSVLALYLDVPRVRIRIVFIGLTLFGAFGAIAYAVLWFLMPSNSPKITYE